MIVGNHKIRCLSVINPDNNDEKRSKHQRKEILRSQPQTLKNTLAFTMAYFFTDPIVYRPKVECCLSRYVLQHQHA